MPLLDFLHTLLSDLSIKRESAEVITMCEKNYEEEKKPIAETNGSEHNLIPDDKQWMDYAKDDMEDFIELQGIYIRQ